MMVTVEQHRAVFKGADDLSHFGRLAPAYKRWKAGSATAREIAYLEVTPQAHIDAALDYQRQMRAEDRRRRRDILVHGQRAISFYAARDALPQTPRETHVPRRPGGASGRPRARAGRTRRWATSRDDGSDEPAPALALAPPPRARYLYAVLTREQRGAA